MATTITILNAFRKILKSENALRPKYSSPQRGTYSGSPPPKAGKYAGCITICVEVNKAAAEKDTNKLGLKRTSGRSGSN